MLTPGFGRPACRHEVDEGSRARAVASTGTKRCATATPAIATRPARFPAGPGPADGAPAIARPRRYPARLGPACGKPVEARSARPDQCAVQRHLLYRRRHRRGGRRPSVGAPDGTASAWLRWRSRPLRWPCASAARPLRACCRSRVGVAVLSSGELKATLIKYRRRHQACLFAGHKAVGEGRLAHRRDGDMRHADRQAWPDT